MKIGLYSPYLDTFGGGEKYIFTAALCLAKSHDITMLWDKTEKEEIVSGVKERFDLDISSLTFSKNIFSSQVSFTKRYQESKKYDAIIVLSDGSIPIVQTKLYLHFQSPITWISPSSLKNRLKMKKVTKVFCNSQFTKSFIDKTYHTDSTVIYPPVEIHPEYAGKKEKMILTVGRFGVNETGSSFKKQEVMIDVFKEMLESGLTDWELTLVMNVKGDEAMKRVQELEKENEKYNITFSINPSFETLWRLYGKAKIYWHAAGFGEDITHHPDRAEHFGISTVEAMGIGAVPVVIDAGGQKEIVTQGEDGYLWKSTDELKKYTGTLIQDEKLRNSLASAAEERAKKFDRDSFCKELEELLR